MALSLIDPYEVQAICIQVGKVDRGIQKRLSEHLSPYAENDCSSTVAEFGAQ